MQIFDHDHEWCALAERLKRLTPLAHHSVATAGDELAAQRFALILRGQGGKLDEPTRVTGTKGVHEWLAHRAAAHACEGLQPRIERLGLRIAVEAVTARDGHALCCGFALDGFSKR